MSFKTCKEVIDEIKDWDFLHLLPEKISDFKLTLPNEINRLELVMARYANSNHCSLDLIYTMETGDFVAVKTVGLNRCKDDHHIKSNKVEFASDILPVLTGLISEIDIKSHHIVSKLVEELGIDKWNYSKQLPKQVGNLKLFISPDNPYMFINGSLILIDYSDFKQKNQLLIMYNLYRNEIFGEYKRNGIPEFTRDFDIIIEEDFMNNTRTNALPLLEKVLNKRLISALESFT